MRSKGNLVGGWAFLIGVVIAVVVGLLGSLNSGWILALVALGLVIGLLNVADEETMPFLISGAVLVIVSALGQDILGSAGELVGMTLRSILNALLALFVPATIIVAIKNVFNLARR